MHDAGFPEKPVTRRHGPLHGEVRVCDNFPMSDNDKKRLLQTNAELFALR